MAWMFPTTCARYSRFSFSTVLVASRMTRMPTTVSGMTVSSAARNVSLARNGSLARSTVRARRTLLDDDASGSPSGRDEKAPWRAGSLSKGLLIGSARW
jgi:hypothetical protein